MKPLNLNRINYTSPYKVWEYDGGFHFDTDFGVAYTIEFEQDESIDYVAYWFGLINRNGKKSPNDSKIQKTIVCIIEEFFRENPDILLYMCDSLNQQEAMRARLFLRWFNNFEGRDAYIIRTAEINDEDKKTEYVALIVPKSHPDIDIILTFFDQEIRMFKEKHNDTRNRDLLKRSKKKK